MTVGTPLVVPVGLDALVVTPAYQGAQAMRRWPFNYTALAQFDSPEPEAGQGQGTTQPPDVGVHLRWSLPDALRHGAQAMPPAGGGQVSVGDLTYPPVPNRWLVVRLATEPGGAARQATAWVVESDCPNPDSPTQYLVDGDILAAWTASGDPERVAGAQSVTTSAQGGPPVALLGKAFPAAGWTERAATATFLTAVAPGNAVFTAYEPHHSGVFSFTDALSGVGADTLTYLVVGWFSNPAEDPVPGAAGAAAALAASSWTLAGGGSVDDAAGTLYQGLALGVPWDPAATSAPPTPLTGLAGSVHAALGMTDVDALTALIAAQTHQPPTAAAVEVLQAFQYGLLPVFEKVNGPELLANAAHQASFGTRPGGTRWTIVPASGDGESAAPLTADEATWLLELNTAQAALDDALGDLADAQAALYGTWWKWQKGLIESEIVPVEGFDADAFAHAVQVTIPAALAQAQSAVTAALPGVPQPVPAAGDTRQAAFERGVTAFAQAKGLSSDKVLKALPGPRYWRSADPVVLLAGVEPATIPGPGVPLACRLASSAVASLTVGGTTLTAAGLGAAVPTLPAGGAPSSCAALLAETFLLDPASAPAIAAASGLAAADVGAAIATRAAPAYAGETLPARGLAAWTHQPWTPLFMEWQVEFLPIPQETNGQPNWAFDGHDYAYTGPFGPFPADPQAPTRDLGGISLLTPQTQFTFRKRLERFLDAYVRSAPNPPVSLADLAALDDQVAGIDGWKLMSQALTGFGDLVAMRDTRAQTAPGASVATAVAGRTGVVPYIPNGTPDTFSGVRQGQFAFTSLLVYDAFGQVLQVVGGTGLTDPQNFAPVLDPALAPDRPAITRNPARLVELRPRLMQHARLDFLLRDGVDDAKVVGTAAGANPVCGWVLPNHLDRSLLLYAPDGSALGSFRLLADDAGTTSARWQPPPHSTLTPADVATAAPRLAAIIGDPALADPAAFTTFLAAIDETLWTTDPLGNRADVNLSVLIGRPLALVRASLSLSLDGAPIGDLTPWSTTWPPPQGDFTGYAYAVRLGDQATRQDGLIGYFAGADTSTFNSVPAPDGSLTQDYVRTIGPVGQTSGTNYLSVRADGSTTQYVTMLVDPRAAVHAVTGILPVKTLEVPPAFVDGPLSALEVSFTTNALLTTIGPTPGSGPTPPANPLAVSVPIPVEQGGTWTWWEPVAAPGSAPPTWSPYDLARATPNATLTSAPTTVRDGYLQLTVDLAAPTPRDPS